MHEISPHDLNRLTCIRCAMSLPTRHDSASSKSAAHQHSAGPGMMMLGVSASMIGHGICTCIHVSGTVGHAPLTRHTRHRSCHTFWQLHQPRRRPPARNSLPEDKRYRLSRWPDLHCALNRTESDRTQISGAKHPTLRWSNGAARERTSWMCTYGHVKSNPPSSGELRTSCSKIPRLHDYLVIQWTLLFAAEEAVEKDRRALQLRRARAAGNWCFLVPLDTASWSPWCWGSTIHIPQRSGRWRRSFRPSNRPPLRFLLPLRQHQ